ncbi:MAG: DNA polymerase III subunit gamma/tau, partial [Bacilli bacterium]
SPCNSCAVCQSITDGSNADVIEMDAASHNGVEYIRDIRDSVQLVPSDATYKVYIIDEVHMLSSGAFNALLKTLEEPPPFVVFILATTEIHKVPLTIMSRCQRFDFFKINRETMANRLTHILALENVVFEQNAIDAVTLAAEGGMRDALSLLDQAISYSVDGLTEEDVLAVTGALRQKDMIEIIRALANQEAVVATRAFLKLYNEGKDPKRFVDDLLYFFRDMIVYQTSNQMADLFERAQLTDEFIMLTTEVDQSYCFNVIHTLTRCQQELRTTNAPKLIIETTLIQLAQTTSDVQWKQQIAAMQSRIDRFEKAIQNGEIKVGAETEARPAPVQAAPRRSNRQEVDPATEGRVFSVLKQAAKKYLADVRNDWPNLIGQLRQVKPQNGALMEKATPRAASSTGLVISFNTHIFCELAQQNPEATEQLRNLLREKWMNDVEVVYLFEDDWLRLRDKFLSSNEPAADKQSVPVVEEAVRLFGEETVHIID